jgi:Ran GTPase-activating protein (RanGAP) involved in mRNA processing and transport
MEEAALDIFLPAMESAMVIASHYAKATGRNCVTAQDVRMGLMFAARHVIGKQVGSLFPEIYEDEEEEEEEEEEEDQEPEENWTRYEGDDPQLKLVNECADTWDEWEPESPAERALKDAVEKATNQ